MSARVLILDDEESILEILGYHLTEAGHEVVCCLRPAEAVEMMVYGGFDMLVTDLKMPDLHGIEVVQRAKQIDPHIAVVVVTAMMDVQNAIEALRAGADDYLLKPFNLVEITIAVDRALERRRLVIENERYQDELERRIDEATSGMRETNAELNRTKTYLENLLHSSVDAIVTMSADYVITYTNLGAAEMLGRSSEQLLGHRITLYLAGGEDELNYIRGVMGGEGRLQNYETELIGPAESNIPVNISLSEVRDEAGALVSILAICKDITQQKMLEAELREAMVKDALTGLYNHGYFFDRLDGEIERSTRQGRPLSLLLFDIDKFKTYNDKHGHLEGDRVLRTVGDVIRKCTREHVDLGFRYGGDEYTVILPEATEQEALQIAERIRVQFKERRFDQLTLSIGLMQYQKGISARSFLRYADAMMYKSKHAGGDRVSIFERSASMDLPEHDEAESA
ncbi:MAG: diguanylate cyclase [Candidatus Hydrogenedens sp.]|nr:diguanylate cyclase [Candidatus Hydrogenedens sp.]